MSKKKSKSRKPSAARSPQSKYKRLTYEISDEPIIDKSYRQLPLSLRNELEDLYPQLADLRKADAHISRLEQLVKEYPVAYTISNYLAFVYSVIQSPKLKDLIKENYKRHPDYLFARIHYAEQCLANNDLEKFNEVFKEGLDLKLLYPQRKRFHVTEFIGFSALVCRYYLTINERHAAELVFQSMEKVAPDHPTVWQTQRLLESTLFTRVINSFGLKSGESNKHLAGKNNSPDSEI